MDLCLKNRITVVTGAGRGLGEALSYGLPVRGR